MGNLFERIQAQLIAEAVQEEVMNLDDRQRQKWAEDKLNEMNNFWLLFYIDLVTEETDV